MENASKALLIAGSVLIALMVLGALVLMFGNLTNYQRTVDESNVSRQIAEFNNQFMPYEKKELSLMELKTVYNKIKSYLEKNPDKEFKQNICDALRGYNDGYSDKHISNKRPSGYTNKEVFSYKSSITDEYDAETDFKKIPDSSKSNRKFKCVGIDYDNEGRINGMYFEDITDYDNLELF